MGKKIPAVMEQQRARFVDGAVDNGHPRDKVGQLFDLILQFAGYGFGKAHSAAYALLTHQTAYLKAHYPGGVLRRHDDRGAARARQARPLHEGRGAKRDIQMRAPCVNQSVAEFSVAEAGRAVLFGLEGVKNVGEGAVEAIVESREQPTAPSAASSTSARAWICGA